MQVLNLHTYAPDGGVDSQLDACRRNRGAGPGPKCDRRGWSGCKRQRLADGRLPRSQAGRNLLIHAERFMLGVSQPGVLVVREHDELGVQPSPIKYRHQLHKLYTAYRATER
jgi:hypothetical protein